MHIGQFHEKSIYYVNIIQIPPDKRKSRLENFSVGNQGISGRSARQSDWV